MPHGLERILIQPSDNGADRRSAPPPQGVAGGALIERLQEVAGLDVATGLRLVGQREALYLRLIQRFVSDHADSLLRVAGAQAAGDAQTAERIAHTLKGVAAQIGAQALHERALGLEQAIRERAPAAEQQARGEAAAALLAELVDALRARLPG